MGRFAGLHCASAVERSAANRKRQRVRILQRGGAGGSEVGSCHVVASRRLHCDESDLIGGSRQLDQARILTGPG